MKGILQYAGADAGPYKNFGTIRPKDGQAMEVKPIEQRNRIDEPVLIGYTVEIEAAALALNTDFRTSDTWYFRIVFLSELEEIRLGNRAYSLAFDGRLEEHIAVEHRASLKFQISLTEYDAYTTPVALPEAEGGVVIEDSGIYVE